LPCTVGSIQVPFFNLNSTASAVMQRFLSVSLFVSVLAAAGPATAATFYVSSTGSDANTATQAQSKSTPWAHLPCMANATGIARAYVPVEGDRFIFKGGETWPRNSFPCTWSGSGTSANGIYIGVDASWFAGATWVRPVLDAGGAPITSTRNVMLDLRSADYITIDNLEFTGFQAATWTISGECAMIQTAGAQNITIDHIYVRNFAIDQASDTNCTAVQGATSPPYAGNSVVQNSVFAGSGSSFGAAVRCFGTVKNTVVRDMVGMITLCGHGEVSGNLLYNCGYPSFPAGAVNAHSGAIQVTGADGAFSIHDNVIHDTGRDANGNECEAALLGNPGETDYVWNNISYNIQGNSWGLTPNASPGVAAYFWNNTMVGGLDGSAYCIRQVHSGTYSSIQIRNNHCITTGILADPTLTASVKLVNFNLVQTPAVAASQGYTASQRFAFSPTVASQPTVGTGVNLTSRCLDPNTGLCRDTGYGSSQSATNTSVSPARLAFARPTGTTAWDIGAYLFSTAPPTPPMAPANLRLRVP
jgi:hypothetical protein